MSGGSYEYLYGRVEDAARQMVRRSATPARRAFAEHLVLVAKALHAVEWVDSCDWGPGDEDEAIKTVLGERADAAMFAVLVADARAAHDALAKALAAVEGEPKRVEQAWLVEGKIGCVPRWWTGLGVQFSDANSAIRFSRREDAERAIRSMLPRDHVIVFEVRATEHQW